MVAYIIQQGDTLYHIAKQYDGSVQDIINVNPGVNPYNLHIGQVIWIPSGDNQWQVSTQQLSQQALLQQQLPQLPPQEISKAEQKLSNLIRLLWEQHVYWTRLFLVSTAFSLPDTELVANRLLRNPKDFEAALKPLYGEKVAAKFSELFTNHLTIAAELVNAAKAGDSAKAADAEKRWYANADEIAAFLGSINPYWSAQEWRKMLYDHLAMTKTEAVNLLTQKYADGIRIFEMIEQEALAMADLMTQGLVSQFSQNFK